MMTSDQPKPRSTAEWIGVTCLRVLIFAFSCIAAVVLPVNVWNQRPRDEFEIIAAFVIAPVFMVMGLAGFWLSLVYMRSRSEESGQLVDSEAPEFSANSLICRCFPPIGKSYTVIVDHEAAMIHFQNCHWPKGFWVMGCQAWFSCPLTHVTRAYRDTVRFHRSGRVDPFFVIETRTGKATVVPLMTNYEALCQHFETYRPKRGI